MPDRTLPPPWRRTLRIARAALYLCVLAAGAAGLVWTPTTIAGTIGEPLTYWWTGLFVASGTVALYAVIADRWRAEWLATWPGVGGGIGYAVAVWGIVVDDSPTRTAQAFVVTGLAIAVAYRGLELAAHAAKLRAGHPRRRRE